MATYEEIMAAAQNAKAEGRDGAARFLATRAYELRTGRPFSVGDAENPEDVYDPTVSEGVAQEFFEGIFSGGTRAVQGVLETGAAAADRSFRSFSRTGGH
jgi:hypothetical protein